MQGNRGVVPSIDLTIASRTSLYWSQLVDPLNLGTSVVLKEAGLG